MNNSKKEYVRFFAAEQTVESETAKLRDALAPFGFEIKSIEGGSPLYPDMVQLEIRWDNKALHQCRTRNAGRPFSPSSVTWDTIDQWRAEGMTAGEIAQKLWVSRATYYNHLKLREKHPGYPCF